METSEVLNLKISSLIDNIGRAVEDILQYLRQSYGYMGEDTEFELRVILNELILNAVRHGNREDASKYVKIGAGILKGEYAYFIIEDEGKGYDYTCLVTPGSEMSEEDPCCLKETGRGLFIVKNLCDRMSFNRAGNKVFIMKKLSKK